MGIRFELTDTTLHLYGPNGDRFLTTVALARAREQSQRRAAAAQQRAETERQRADRLPLACESWVSILTRCELWHFDRRYTITEAI